MSRKLVINILIFFCIFITGTNSMAYSEPIENLIEASLLQQLHPVIMTALRNIYKEEYSQYGCERIISINERLTIKNTDHRARPVDAIHGAKYFEITIVVCRTDAENVELILKNDTATAQYYLSGYKIFSTK